LSFTCGVPRDAGEFAQLFTVEQTLFGNLAIPAAVAREIFAKRPETFCLVLGPDKAVAAYSIAYPLQPRWANALIAGDITETDLTPAMLLDHCENHEGACIYISSVVVDKKYDAATKAMLLANLLSWRAQQLHLVSLKRLSVVMMPTSRQGERLARLIGAKELNNGLSRKDGYPIYCRQVSPRFLARATDAIEKFCNPRLVAMNLDFGLDGSMASHRTERSCLENACATITTSAEAVLDTARAGAARLLGRPIDARNMSSLLPAALVALLAAILLSAEIPVLNEHPAPLFLIAIWLLALRFGRVPMLFATVVAGLSAAFFFYPPTFSFRIDDPFHVAELFAFVVAAATGVALVNKLPFRRL